MSTKIRNIKLLIAYDGTGFSGWQRQLSATTIQGEIERSLCRMTREDINLHGAGRTDAGVHAEGMVAHFITSTSITCDVFLRGLNSMLSRAIRIFLAEEVASDFHSRYLATGKHYQYSLFTGRIHPPRLRLYSLHVTSPLNLEVIQSCLGVLEGTHDFSSFENAGSRDKNNSFGRGAVRTIYKAKLVSNNQEQLDFNFTGDGFLRNMIRNIMGTLLEAGRGKLSTEDFKNILDTKDRAMGGPTAAAHGLCLKRVFY